MLDRSIKVRHISLIELHNIAFGQFGKDSDEVVVGINKACNDPEIGMRSSRIHRYNNRRSNRRTLKLIANDLCCIILYEYRLRCYCVLIYINE